MPPPPPSNMMILGAYNSLTKTTYHPSNYDSSNLSYFNQPQQDYIIDERFRMEGNNRSRYLGRQSPIFPTSGSNHPNLSYH
jgi:hypothetical protein